MSHSYCKNYVHAVYSTKNRTNLIRPELEKRLYAFLAAVAHNHHIPLMAAGGMPNHVHVLFMLPSTMPVAAVVSVLKANSSRFLREQVINFEWQQGYGAFSVSPSQLEKATAYIKSQHEHHRKISFEEEFLALLEKSGIPYDAKHVFG
jgi:putative transposase